MSLIPTPYLLLAKIGAVGVLLLGTYLTGHHQGGNAVQADWDRSKAQLLQAQNKLITDHAKEMAELQEKHDADNILVSQQHQEAINELAKKYDSDVAAVKSSGGLRIPRAVCSGPNSAGTETASDSGHNETVAATVELPTELEGRLFSEAKRADEIVEQARACQNWIQKNGFYGFPIPDVAKSQSSPLP